MAAVSVILETLRLRLIPVTREMAIDLLGANPLAGLRWAPSFAPVHIPAQAFIDSSRKFAGLHLFLSKELGEVLGYSRFEVERSAPETVWLYYGVAEQRQRRGFGTEGVKAQVEWLSDQPRIEAVKAYVHWTNEGSIVLLRKLGFRRATTGKQELWVLDVTSATDESAVTP